MPLRERYETIAQEWETEKYAGIRRDDLLPKLIETVDIKDVGRPLMILDAMSGTARVGSSVKEFLVNQEIEANVIAVDFSRAMLKEAKKQHGIEGVQADVLQLPFQNEQFDYIFLRDAAHDIPRHLQEQLFHELNRVLKSDGALALSAYITDKDTNVPLNELVRMRDALASWNKNGSENVPERYFPTEDELFEFLSKAGFVVSKKFDFTGSIAYTQQAELGEKSKAQWLTYAQSLPDDVKDKIHLHQDDTGNTSFDFPAAVYSAHKVKND